MSPRLRSASCSRRGFTAVEVLISIALLAIGAGAVMSMQKVSIQSNLDARKTDVANSIARTWADRLHREAMRWTEPSSLNAANDNYTNSPILAKLTSGVAGTTTTWIEPSQEMGSAPEMTSYAFDILGRDLASTDINPKPPDATAFCVNIRLTWLVGPNLAASPPEPGLMRADVRVFWPIGIVNSAGSTWCSNGGNGYQDTDAAIANTNGPVFHTIYLTTTLAEGG